MSIYATLWKLKFPKDGDDFRGCDWIEATAQGVPPKAIHHQAANEHGSEQIRQRPKAGLVSSEKMLNELEDRGQMPPQLRGYAGAENHSS
jgi:hypothetical protein